MDKVPVLEQDSRPRVHACVIAAVETEKVRAAPPAVSMVTNRTPHTADLSENKSVKPNGDFTQQGVLFDVLLGSG